MKYIGVLLTILLLGVIAPSKACTSCDGQINVLSVIQVNAHVLAINLQLDAAVDISLSGTLAVDVNVQIQTNGNLVFVGGCPAIFSGVAGEIVTVHVDVGANTNILVNADVGVHLGNLHLGVDLDLVIVLGPDFACHLLNGVVQLVDSLLGGLLGSLFGQPNAVVAVVNVQILTGNRVQVSLQCQNFVLGGLSLDLNVDVLNSLGVVAHINTQHVSFTGVQGQIVICVLDLSTAVNLVVNPEICLQLSVGNVRIPGNLLGTIKVGVTLTGFNRCLDACLQVVSLPRVFVNVGLLEISSCVLNGHTLSVSVLLDADLNIGGVVDVDLDVVIFTNANLLLSQVIPCHFTGVPGQVVVVNVDLSGLNLSAEAFVYLELAHVQVSVNAIVSLCNGQLFSLLNGLLNSILCLP